jgi:4-hydroxy-tetrahydrodipicolinate synthase
VEWQIAEGIDGLVPCGSTGESATMSHDEHRRAVEIVVGAARGRVPVIAGTGSNNTREAVELTRHARDAGANAALLISPYYNKPTQDGIVAHYAEIARQTGFPLVYYNIAGRTASNIEVATQARLARIPNVVGVKEASGDLGQISEVIASTPDAFCVLSGDDALTLPLLSIGGQGVISVSTNVAPREMLELVRAYRAGDVKKAQEHHYRQLPLFGALFCETNPIPVKAAMHLMGRCGPEIRLPLTPITERSRERLQSVLEALDVL